jgi:hypothetical protein
MVSPPTSAARIAALHAAWSIAVSSVTSTISAAGPELASRHLHATLCEDTRSIGAAPYLPTWRWCWFKSHMLMRTWR